MIGEPVSGRRLGSRPLIALLAAFLTMTAMSIDMNLPAIPAIARGLDATLTASQLTVTLFFAGFAAGQLVWGPMSDRFGRRSGMLIGTALFVAASLGCALAPTIGWLLGLRVLQGFAAGAGSTLGRAIVRDLFTGPEMARVLSLVMTCFIMAPIIAPSIGALILGIAPWRAIFALLSLYGLLLLVLTVLFLDESLKVRNPDALQPVRLLRAFAAVFRNPASRAPAWTVVLVYSALDIYLATSPAVFMAGYGMTPGGFGLVFAGIAVFMAAGTLLNARLVRFMGLRPIMLRALVVGVGVTALTLLAAQAHWGGWWPLVPGLGCFFVTFGMVAANGTTLSLEPHSAHAGAAVAALGFGQTIVPAIAASIAAAAFDGTPRPMLIGMLAAALSSLAVLGLRSTRPALAPTR